MSWWWGAGKVYDQPSASPVVSALPRALLSLPLFLWSTRPANWEKGLLGDYWHKHQHHTPSWRKYACKGMWLLWLLQSSAVSVLGHWRLTRDYWKLLEITDINTKSTEVQTSPMLASDAQLPACGIYTSVVLNTTNYIIITDITARLNLEESHQQ